MCRCGTLGYGLVGMVVLGGWLDSMILEVLSNLRFYDSVSYQRHIANKYRSNYKVYDSKKCIKVFLFYILHLVIKFLHQLQLFLYRLTTGITDFCMWNQILLLV